jgi:hypothetical protein
MTEVTGEDVLAVRIEEGDSGAATVREFFVKLAAEVWHEGEGFSGKRPFGNSGWEYEIFQALGSAGLIAVREDRWGDHEYDLDRANDLVKLALVALAHPESG